MLGMNARERTQYQVKQKQEEQRKKREEAAKQESARRQYTTEGAYTPKTKVDGSSAAAAKTTNQTSRAFAKETGALVKPPAKKTETKPAAKPAAKSDKPASKSSSSGSSKPPVKPKSKTVTDEQVKKLYGDVPKVVPTKKKPKPKRSGYTRMWER